MGDTEPTPAQILNAIAHVCDREGIPTTPANPTPLGQVLELIQRIERAEMQAAEYKAQRDQIRIACYRFAENSRLLADQVQTLEAEAAAQPALLPED
jgi:hypothetical protein